LLLLLIPRRGERSGILEDERRDVEAHDILGGSLVLLVVLLLGRTRRETCDGR